MYNLFNRFKRKIYQNVQKSRVRKIFPFFFFYYLNPYSLNPVAIRGYSNKLTAAANVLPSDLPRLRTVSVCLGRTRHLKIIKQTLYFLNLIFYLTTIIYIYFFLYPIEIMTGIIHRLTYLLYCRSLFHDSNECMTGRPMSTFEFSCRGSG